MSPRLFSRFATALNALASRRLIICCDGIAYPFERVAWRKLWNWFRVESSTLFRPERPWGWPTHLMVEPATLCNLRCALCPITIGLDRKGQFMPLPLFQRTIDQLGANLFLILLWDWGEPFLNPSIYDMIIYARRCGIRVVSSTNGHMFTDPDEADRLVRSGLDSLIFAVDGITQASYERYRQGGNLEQVLTGIRTVVERRRTLGADRPFLNLRFIVMKDNEHEIPALKELARGLGVDALSLKTLNPCSQDPYFETDAHRRGLAEFTPDNPRYRRFPLDPRTGDRIRRRGNPCKNLWNCPTVHADGTVCPCTYDPKEHFVLGNLAAQSFREIWHGEPYRQMRRGLRRDYQRLPLCRDCSYAFEGGSLYDESIAEVLLFSNAPGPTGPLPTSAAGD